MHTNTTSPRRLALLLTLTLGGTASAAANPMGMMQGMQGSDIDPASTAMMGDTASSTAPQSRLLATDNAARPPAACCNRPPSPRSRS